MMKGFRVRLLPTEEQESLLWQNAGVARFAWNWGLALQMKRFEDGDRWLMATAHSELNPPLALQHFDCALDVRTADGEAPALKRLAERLMRDAVGLAETSAARFHRARPIADDPARRACERMETDGRARSSWPGPAYSTANGGASVTRCYFRWAV